MQNECIKPLGDKGTVIEMLNRYGCLVFFWGVSTPQANNATQFPHTPGANFFSHIPQIVLVFRAE